MTFIIGLTGSIGMGKTTTAAMFSKEGIPVWDADGVVRSLYAQGGPAVDAIKRLCPGAVQNGAVDRNILRAAISDDPSLLERINTSIHPLVAQERAAFLDQHKGQIVLLDIPLLFETGTHENCDFVVVVSVPANIQKQRVLDRGEMTAAEFNLILSKQIPDAEKRAKADIVIETTSMDAARNAVRAVVKDIRQRTKHA